MEKEPKVCELHKPLACEVEKCKFFRRVFGSKIFISILSFLFLTALSWCIYIQNCINARAAEVSSNNATVQAEKESTKAIAQKASKDMDEVKVEIKEIRGEMKGQIETINKNQIDTLKLLMEIQREQRKLYNVEKGNER